jgi:hypothetical protein
MLESDHVDPLAPFGPLLDSLAERIVDKWLEKTGLRMVPQSVSPLGPRKHREAVRRRVQNNEGGAFIDANGRKYLLTREALAEELRLRQTPKPSAAASAAPTSGDPTTPAAATSAAPGGSDPDAAAYARDLLMRVQSMRTPKKVR